jgi:hypothetical protein
VSVLDRFDFITRMRVRGTPAVLGIVFLGVLAVSVGLYFLVGNSRSSRVLFFPTQDGRRLVAEERMVPRHRAAEQNVTELVEGVLLGPARQDAARLFPRGGRVLSAMAAGRELFVDLSPQILLVDREVPLAGDAALAALRRTIRFNFPRFREVVFYIDGQAPVFPGEKKI